MTDNRAGDAIVKAGDGGPNGKGGDITIIGGTIKGGDAISHPSSPSRLKKKQWFEKPIGIVLLGLVVAGLAYYFGWH